MKYVVTGHKGYIGSVLYKMLKAAGHYVIGIDLKSSNYDYIGDEYAYWFLYNNYDTIDGIFHLGASSILNKSLTDPLSYYENNVSDLTQFLLYLKEYKYMNPIVFASSAAVYGDNKELVTENSEKNPINPYGRTKLMGEQIISDAASVMGFNYYNCRFFNVAGSYMNSGQDFNQPHIITSLSRTAIRKTDSRPQVEFVQYGNNIRDYIHVRDVCNALIMSMDHLSKTPSEICPIMNLSYYILDSIKYDINHDFRWLEYKASINKALNISTGIETDTNAIVKAFKEITKTDFKVRKERGRNGDPQFLVGSPTSALNSIGWKPYYSSIGNIIESQWEYFQSQLQQGLIRV